MFLWLKTLYRKRAVTWPFIFYTIIWTLSIDAITNFILLVNITKEIIILFLRMLKLFKSVVFILIFVAFATKMS